MSVEQRLATLELKVAEHNTALNDLSNQVMGMQSTLHGPTPAEVASACFDVKTRHRTKQTKEGTLAVKRKRILHPSKFPPDDPVEKRSKNFRSVHHRWAELVNTDHPAVPDTPDTPDSPPSSESVGFMQVRQTYTSEELRETAVPPEGHPHYVKEIESMKNEARSAICAANDVEQ